MSGMGEERQPYAARLRERAVDTVQLSPAEADAVADALDALAGLVERDPVEEDPLDLIYRCRFCRENGRHLEVCPWLQGTAALDRLAGREGT